MTSCTPAPAPHAPPDPTTQRWYGETLAQLTALDRDAQAAYRSGDSNRASALIQKGEPLMNRLLAVPRPTLPAARAASDLDDLYGRMLLANRHYGWARLLFQKNLARWKHWQPQTEETTRLRNEANAAIAECDRHL